MPRDITGVYTLPAGNPVVTGTTIASVWANNTLSDIATALTQSLSIDGSVTTAKLANGAVTNAKLAVNSVGTTNIIDLAVTNAKLAANSVNDVKIVDGTVTNPKLAGNSVSTVNIINGNVTPVKLGNVSSGQTGVVTMSSDANFTVTNSPTMASPTVNTLINLTGGQIVFPATQVPSAGANTLDDYEEGTWTPVFTTVTPGDLGVTGVTASGSYTKIGNTAHVWCFYSATNVTHTTAAGSMVITGIPFAIGVTTCGPIIAGTLDNINLTDFSGATFSAIGGNSRFDIGLSNLNAGAASQSVNIGGHTSGTGIFLLGEVTYRV